jgi:DNA-binding beta-propeller fold protein YncE
MKHSLIAGFVFWAATGLLAESEAESLVYPPYLHSFGIRKATPAKLFLFFGAKTAFDDPQGIAAAKMKSRDDPSTDKDDDELVVYGVNSGRGELIYNTSMWSLALYGSKGGGKDRFLNPKGVAIDPDGNVYVADCGNGRVVHLFNPGKTVHWVNSFTGAGAADSGLKSPAQVALDNAGMIYVTDPGRRRIVVFTPLGEVARTIPGRGEFSFENGPEMLAVADGAVDKSNYFIGEHALYCADRNGARLWKIDLGGRVVKQADLAADEKAGYAAIDFYHNLWVTDREKHCVLKFDKDLGLLDVFGSYGTDKNQFIEPRGIAVWKRYGQVFIAEKKGAQYFWVGTDLKSKNLASKGNNLYSLTLDLTEYSFISFFKLSGRDTSWVVHNRFTGPARASIDFRDTKNIIGPGATMLLKIEPTYSSYLYDSWVYPVSIEKKD